MLNQKQIASTKPPVVGQVWFSESARNYYLIDETDGQTVTVTRLAYECDGIVRRPKILTGPFHWNVSTFKINDLRVVGTNPTRFHSWLNRVAE